MVEYVITVASWAFPFLVNNKVISKYRGNLEDCTYDLNSICRSVYTCFVNVYVKV